MDDETSLSLFERFGSVALALNEDLKLPKIGQGIGQYKWDESHIKIIQAGIDLGMNFIDTAEIYDNGRAEEIVGKATKWRRNKVVIATKASPEHLSMKELVKAVDRSLKRLQTDYIDLYQIHWPNPSIPLEETILTLENLSSKGKIRKIGLCNFYLNGIKKATDCKEVISFDNFFSVQLEYNLFDRSIEDGVTPYCHKNGIVIFAYSPLDKGIIADSTKGKILITELCKKYNKTPAQICLNWLINNHRSLDTVIPIVKTTNLKHLKANSEANNFSIIIQDLGKISNVFDRKPVNISTEAVRTSEVRVMAMDDMVPGPIDLGNDINLSSGQDFKPIRVVQHPEGGYVLTEGYLRFYAWKIAFGDKPIPTYIRESNET